MFKWMGLGAPGGGTASGGVNGAGPLGASAKPIDAVGHENDERYFGMENFGNTW